MTRLAAQLGLAFAVALTIIETVHNWGDWSNPAVLRPTDAGAKP